MQAAESPKNIWVKCVPLSIIVITTSIILVVVIAITIMIIIANTTISILIINNIMMIITKDAKDRSALRPTRDQELHGGQALALVAGLR